MAASNLQELFIHEVKDLYNANQQTRKFHELLVDTAHNTELRQALTDAVKGIDNGIDALGTICRNHDNSPDGVTCKGMRGLIDEAESHVFEEKYADQDVQDAVIISQAQRMAHYALAGYGTAAAFACALGDSESESILKSHLDNIYSGDRRLTKLAEGCVNNAAKS